MIKNKTGMKTKTEASNEKKNENMTNLFVGCLTS